MTKELLTRDRGLLRARETHLSIVGFTDPKI